MTKQEELEKELKSHWNNTKEEREKTHTGVLYEEFLKNKKKWNVYRFLTTIVLVFMILVFILMSLIIKEGLNLIEDYSEDFIDFIKNLLLWINSLFKRVEGASIVWLRV